VLFNVVQARDGHPMVHRGNIAWLDHCRERGLRTVVGGKSVYESN